MSQNIEIKATPEEARNLRHAYFACVSYVDAQIGKVLKELDRLDLRKNTVVVVWGDHVWHLGNLGIWGKHTVFDVALISPLIIQAPMLKKMLGEKISSISESIDLFPTLCRLCNLEIPDNLPGQNLLNKI
jgi:iduronate 2-sulfatase